MQLKWFKGDNHLHTTNSDGKLKLYELIARAKKAGLDYIIVTDHNYDTVKTGFSSEGLTVIKGQEVTGSNGHMNVWGADVGFEPPYDLSNIDCYNRIAAKAKKNGAYISVNHPFCSLCGFHAGLDSLKPDCVEIWNTIQHSDNVKCLDWWLNNLDEGRFIPAVGGSDFHSDIAFIDMMAMPCTVVHAPSNSPEDILEAMKLGRCFVTNKPNSAMLYLNVGSAQLGDTVALDDGLTGSIRATKLMPGDTLTVFNNRTPVYKKTFHRFDKCHSAYFSVREKGYVWAIIEHTYSLPVAKLYSFGESTYLGADKKPLPPLFRAMTNPVFIG